MEPHSETTAAYDPFLPGPFSVGVRTLEARDTVRNQTHQCEVWYPAGHPGTFPLIVFSHSSGGRRTQSSFLCTHLSSHGYIVAAPDHSETIAPELARKDGETEDQRAARVAGWIANRVPDVVFILDYLLATHAWNPEAKIDPSRIGIVGHSFGGWTALAAADVEMRIRAIVALAPGGASNPKPGILPLNLSFNWNRDIPTLYLVAENDISLPLAGMYEIFDKTPATKKLVILRRADHLHFMDNVEQIHEAVRAMPMPPILSWVADEMRPIAELCSGQQAQLFVRGLTLCHLDAFLKEQEPARRYLESDLEAELAARGVEGITGAANYPVSTSSFRTEARTSDL